MHVETIGNRRYAFGLQWTTRDEDLSESLSQALPDDCVLADSIVYTTPAARRRRGDDYGTVGFFLAEKKQSTAVYSAAATIAAACDDALYVMPVGEHIWYCGVRGGVAIEGTDVLADATTAEDAIEELSSALDLPIRVEAGTEAQFVASETFDVLAFLQHAKPHKMRMYRQAPSLLVPVVVVALVVLGAGYYFTQTGSQSDRMTPAQKRAQAKARYVSGAKRRIGAYPASNQWALMAYRNALGNFPAYYAGWNLHEVSCVPSACTASYAVQQGEPYALTPMKEKFSAVRVGRRGRTLTVTHALNAPLDAVTESWLRTLPKATVPLADWLGAVPLTMPEAKVGAAPLVVDLGQQFHASKGGMPGSVMEQVQVQGSGWLSPAYLNGLVFSGATGGFRVLKLDWIAEPGKAARWSMVWGRVHG